METFKDEIEEICKKIIMGDIVSYTSQPIDKNKRKIIYDIVSKYDKLTTQTKENQNANKNVTIQNKCTDKENLLCSNSIKFFSDYARVPIALCDKKYIQYYLDTLDPYYDCKRLWDLFCEAYSQSNIQQIRMESQNVKNNIIKYFKENDEYNTFVNSVINVPTEILCGSTLYTPNNANKWFISIDVRTANYRVLMKYCPSIANTEWKDFIKNFTNTKFLIESKHFRETIFGELCCKKINKLPLVFVKECIDFINSDYKLAETLEKVLCSNDEVIYEVNPSFNCDNLRKIIEEKFPNTFKIEKYKLIQMKDFLFFAKEKDNNKVEFKSIPKKFLMQCVKYYEKREITELDRKFTDEGITATYDSDIFSEYI